ncbi:Uncharacterised protein [Mycobacteroides abscessus subsp. abscessus]|nr:Uncharacterised protein [Mycobacteroides abscessus subsp. abscessus]
MRLGDVRTHLSQSSAEPITFVDNRINTYSQFTFGRIRRRNRYRGRAIHTERELVSTNDTADRGRGQPIPDAQSGQPVRL